MTLTSDKILRCFTDHIQLELYSVASTCSTVQAATLLAVIPSTVGRSLLCWSQQNGMLGEGVGLREGVGVGLGRKTD